LGLGWQKPKINKKTPLLGGVLINLQ